MSQHQPTAAEIAAQNPDSVLVSPCACGYVHYIGKLEYGAASICSCGRKVRTTREALTANHGREF